MLKFKNIVFYLVIGVWITGICPVHDIENQHSIALADPNSSSFICHIVGKAQLTASHFELVVYGPDDKNKLNQSHILDYRRPLKVGDLAEGTYWINIQKRADTKVKVSPAKFKTHLESGETYEFKVELK